MARRVLAALLTAALVAPPGAAAAARPFLGLEAGYKRGDFGTATTSSLYSVILSGGLVAREWHLGFALPFHNLDTEGSDGEAGLGDLFLHGGHSLLPETDGGLSVYGSAVLKVPTADEQNNLGTGETDAGGFLTVRQRLGRWKLAAFGGYTVIGDPPGTDFNNVATYGFQGTRFLSGAALYGGVEGRSAITDDSDDALEAFAGGFRLLPGERALTADAFVGLTDGSAGLGVRVGVVQWF